MILSGQAFAPSTFVKAELEHNSALAILQSPEDGGRCHFQGALAVCEDTSRDVQCLEGSPRKRKNPSAEGKAADAMLVDKTGPVSVCLWGDATEDLCTVWRQAQERREAGEDGPCVVDLFNVLF